MSIGGNGSALSYAASSQSAAARLATNLSPSRTGASVAGETATRSTGVAYNLSSGAATGLALSAGSAGTQVQGAVGLRGGQFAGGIAGAGSSFSIVAARNQGSSVDGHTAAGFEASMQRGGQAAAPSYGGTPGAASGWQVSTTGYVAGSNTSAALPGMNAAGVARIDGTGHFEARSQAGTAAPVAAGHRRHGGAK
jgi:hypothetical protein